MIAGSLWAQAGSADHLPTGWLDQCGNPIPPKPPSPPYQLPNGWIGPCGNVVSKPPSPPPPCYNLPTGWLDACGNAIPKSPHRQPVANLPTGWMNTCGGAPAPATEPVQSDCPADLPTECVDANVSAPPPAATPVRKEALAMSPKQAAAPMPSPAVIPPAVPDKVTAPSINMKDAQTNVNDHTSSGLIKSWTWPWSRKRTEENVADPVPAANPMPSPAVLPPAIPDKGMTSTVIVEDPQSNSKFHTTSGLAKRWKWSFPWSRKGTDETPMNGNEKGLPPH
jgi:hypothetical protein